MSDDDTENNSDTDADMESPMPPADTGSTGDFLEDTFGITKAGSTVETEIRAGVTTFLTMAYILFVNPSIPLVEYHSMMHYLQQPLRLL